MIAPVPPTPAPAPTFPPLTPTVDVNEVYATICTQIIKEQSLIMGTLALEQASHVAGLSVDPVTHDCRITGAGAMIVEQLVNQYRDFFGKAAVEVCREAAARFMNRLPPGGIPTSLQ